MTMDFYPPRLERPGRGVRLLLVAAPIGVVGYWFVSWSLLLSALFMVFLGLVEVLLYRTGARTRVIRLGRVQLLVAGSVVVIVSVIGGSAITLLRLTAPIGANASSPMGGDAPDEILLAAAIGIGAGIGSLIYFAQRFSKPGGADPR